MTSSHTECKVWFFYSKKSYIKIIPRHLGEYLLRFGAFDIVCWVQIASQQVFGCLGIKENTFSAGTTGCLGPVIFGMFQKCLRRPPPTRTRKNRFKIEKKKKKVISNLGWICLFDARKKENTYSPKYCFIKVIYHGENP